MTSGGGRKRRLTTDEAKDVVTAGEKRKLAEVGISDKCWQRMRQRFRFTEPESDSAGPSSS